MSPKKNPLRIEIDEETVMNTKRKKEKYIKKGERST